MKIIIANYRYYVAGGPEQYLFRVTEALQERGVEVIPFSVAHPDNHPTPYASYFARPRADAALYQDTKKSIKNLAGLFRATVWNTDAEKRLTRLIRDTHPDAVYILHEINHLSPSIIRAAHKEGVRVVHRISDFFMFCPRYDFLCGEEVCEACLHGDFRKALKERCVKGSYAGTKLRVFAMRLYRRRRVFDDVDCFVCTCDFTANKLVQGGIPAKKIEVIPTFADMDPPHDHVSVPSDEPGISLRRQGADSPDMPADHDNTPDALKKGRYFLYAGRVAVQKGVRYAVLAMRHLKDTGYRLLITGSPGDGEEGRIVSSLIRAHHLEEVVLFTGFLHGAALDDLIDHCTCVICPSIWYENLPNAVLEAYAHGKSVVASGIGSLTEMVEEGETGYLFPPKDADVLAEKLRLFVEDEGLGARLGQRAREVCEARYGKAQHVKRLLEVLSDKNISYSDPS